MPDGEWTSVTEPPTTSATGWTTTSTFKEVSTIEVLSCDVTTIPTFSLQLKEPESVVGGVSVKSL